MQTQTTSNLTLMTAVRLVVCVVMFWFGGQAQAQFQYGNGISRVPEPSVWISQSADRDEFRSKSEVVREVKERYDARVLKISLNEKRGVYRVRILMPDGKVRNISVNALR